MLQPLIQVLWKNIETWLKDNAPITFNSLRRGATIEEISLAEAALGVQFPEDMRESYQIHDGQEVARFLNQEIIVGGTLMEGWVLLSLEQIVDEWRIWKGLLDEGVFTERHSDPDPGVAADWWNPKWIPLTSSGDGDNHCVDLAPDSGGQAGQIIEIIHDESGRPLVASSFSSWLQTFTRQLELGQYGVTDEGTLARIEDL